MPQGKAQNQKAYYESVWKSIRITKPSTWSGWEVIQNFEGKQILEIGPGSFPRIPVKGSYFIDISKALLKRLQILGGHVFYGDQSLTFLQDNFFDLIVAFNVLEHIENDDRTLEEIKRILKRGGYFYFMIPIWKNYFSDFDFQVGHQRRYESKELENKLSENGFKIIKWRPAGLLNWFYSFRWGRMIARHFCVHVAKKEIMSNFLSFIVKGGLKLWGFLEKWTQKDWQIGELSPKKRTTNLEVLCTKI